MSDPNYYRFYECNLDCYKLKAEKEFRCPKCDLGEVTATSVDTTSLTLDGITMICGSSPLSTTHLISPAELPLLANRSMNGEITFYLNNDVYVNVSMAVIVKAAGSILQTLIYQRVGNMSSVEMTFSKNDLILTTSPATVCRWIYRGI